MRQATKKKIFADSSYRLGPRPFDVVGGVTALRTACIHMHQCTPQWHASDALRPCCWLLQLELSTTTSPC